MTRTLLLIFAALTLMIGSFVWFVVTWDASKEDPIGVIWPDTAPMGPNSGISDLNQRLASSATLTAITGPYQTHTGPIPNPYGVL